jgi:probable addiction module antidote protein
MRKQASRDYRVGLFKALQDPAEAAAYLNAALEENSQEAFLLALKDVCEARGISTVSKEAQLNRENMYRILSKKGNPKLSTLTSLLEIAGLKLAVRSS